MFRSALVLLLSALMLSACTETEFASHLWKRAEGPSAPSQQNGFKIGNPYQVAGKWYTPSESYGYDETGISSWYGDEFHGKRTANGEIFNKNDLTAAHPTLQLPSLIRVTNLENGRSAVLRVNDRGPFSKSRLIDVSHRAATVLGYDLKGTARVRVQVLERESRILADAARKGYSPNVQMAMAFQRPTDTQQNVEGTQVANIGNAPLPPIDNSAVTASDLTPAPQNVTRQDIDDLNKQLFRKYPVSPTSLYIQVGSFTDVNNANAARQKLSSLGHANIYQTNVNGQNFNRVRLGPINTVEQADAMLKRAFASGFSAARIVVD